jgi:pyruvate/2-oxoglutarate dehydrogenase complex dihydrolipoamide acyltransferase (E2) component
MPPEGSGSQETTSTSSESADRRAIFEQEYDGRSTARVRQPSGDPPDLTLDVPSLGVEELNLDVENLRARVSLHAELADMVKLSVGVEADVDKVKLEAKGVEAQLILKAGLDNVRDILGRALDALDDNPGILEDLFRTSGDTSGGAGRALEDAAGSSEDAPAQGVDENTEAPATRDEGAAREPKATDAARRKAEELGVDLAQVEGTGAGGRVLVTDVKKAAR